MSKKWITILVAAVIGAMVFVPTAAMATCQATILGTLKITDTTNPATITDPTPSVPGDKVGGVQDSIAAVAGGSPINGEGQAERLSDILIYDSTGVAGATFCFNAGNVITITFNGVLTNPAVGTSLSQVNNMDVYDSNGIGGLSIVSATVGQAFAANTTQTIITITVGASGTAGGVVYYNAAPPVAGSALRVKNLRIDATTVTGLTGTLVTVNAAQGINPVAFAGPAGTTVATKLLTNSFVQRPAVPVAGGIASGVQNSGLGLRGGITGFGFTPGFGLAYRLKGGSCQTTPGSAAANGTCASGVSNDIATGATSLAFSVGTIPSGVTVSFPSKMDTTALNGGAANALTFTARTATLNNGGAAGTFSVIYDTTARGATPGSVLIETSDNADSGTAIGATNPNCAAGLPINASSACDATPKIGVLIGASSAAGTATLNVAFGPADTSLFTGDDAATTGLIPRYTCSGAPGDATFPAAPGANATFTRYIVKARNFFVVTPTRSTLLFPFVSTVGNFNTGISIANTCADSQGSVANSVYGTAANSLCNQTGGVTLYFFGVDPTNASAVVQTFVNSDLTQGGTNIAAGCPRGLDTNGRVVPGKILACSLTALLPLLPGAPKGFEGYVIAVTGFNNAHGFSAQFNAAGSPFGANPALVLAAGGPRTAGDAGNGSGN